MINTRSKLHKSPAQNGGTTNSAHLKRTLRPNKAVIERIRMDVSIKRLQKHRCTWCFWPEKSL